MIGSDQAARLEGLDDVRVDGVRCRVLPFDKPRLWGFWGLLREVVWRRGVTARG
jgi:hypothetical protein